jgi:multidrug efflux system membrane fusion protein
MKIHSLPSAALATGIAFFAAGCRPPATPPQAFVPPSVTVAQVATQELVETEEITGRLEAVEAVEVRPRVSGYLTEIRFQSGQLVKKGDVLFVIDLRPKQAAVDRATAEVDRARVRLENAERESARAIRLMETKAISNEEAEQRKWAVMDARAAIAAAEAQLTTARLDLEFCEVRSPIDGKVSRAMVTVGNNVSGVDGFTTLLTTVVSVDPLYVYADVPEATLLKFQPLERSGKLPKNADGRIEVEVGLTGEEGFPHKAYIESFDNRVSADTGSILLRALVANPDRQLVPGLFARVRIPVGERKPYVLVSERAIGSDLGQKFVMALSSSNTAMFRTVHLGKNIGGQRIVRDGLQPGETIIVDGLQRVMQPGMPVTPEKEPKLAAGSPNR